ncbi:MAG: sigma-70 family RNA polymerase sigma factor [Dehalococcoidia bacterium]|nr:sigma-70 family RNA polymerase sigma factor [Dehalococcoidia bacterium]
MSLENPADKPLQIRSLPWGVDINEDASSEAGSLTNYATAPDELLVNALEERDPKALEALYDRYGDYVYSICLRMVRDVQLAEDLTQEVFLRVWRRPDLFDSSRGRFLTWLLSVARNRSIDERRSRGRRFKHENPPSLAAEEMLASAPSTQDGEDPAVLSDERVVIQKALHILPPDQRLAIQLAYFGGYTQQEIAKGLGQPLGTIKTRIRLGLQKLRISLIDQRNGSVRS